MKDIKCPYCGHEQDIDHDDGQGYAESELHEQECEKCEKSFGFYTTISFSYDPVKVPCFNDSDCEWVENRTHKWVTDEKHTTIFYCCAHCGKEKREDFYGK